MNASRVRAVVSAFAEPMGSPSRLDNVVVHPPKEGRKVSQDGTSWVRNLLLIVRVEQDRFDIVCNDTVKVSHPLGVKLGGITAGSTQFNRVADG